MKNLRKLKFSPIYKASQEMLRKNRKCLEKIGRSSASSSAVLSQSYVVFIDELKVLSA